MMFDQRVNDYVIFEPEDIFTNRTDGGNQKF